MQEKSNYRKKSRVANKIQWKQMDEGTFNDLDKWICAHNNSTGIAA